jgi:hypothetical protein
MKKFIVLPLIALALAVPATANAWTYSIAGSAACNAQTGQYDVLWTVDNSSEPDVLTIRSSNRAAVPTGVTVGARASSTFTESVAGGTSGSLGLTVSGNWPSDSRERTRGTSVSLAGDCTAPRPPPPPPPAPAPPPTTMGDDCPNLDGVQGSVPEGMIKDSENNCVTRPTPTEPQPTISSPPAAPAATPVVAPAVVAPAIITTQPTEGVARATKTKVKRKAAPKAAPKAKKAKKAKKKVSAGGIKGAKPSALPRTR